MGKPVRALVALAVVLAGLANLPQGAQAPPVSKCGSSAADETWASGDIVTVCSGGYTVLSGHTLTVEGGVSVKFDLGGALYINGTLRVDGTAASPVTFQPSAGNAQSGDWEGITFNDVAASGSYVHHATVDRAVVGFELVETPLSLDNVTITGHLLWGLSALSNRGAPDTISLANSRVVGGDPIDSSGIIVRNFADLRLQGVNVSGNAFNGLVLSLWSTGDIQDSEFWGNGLNAVRLGSHSEAAIINATLANSGFSGITFYSANATIEDAEIFGNGWDYDVDPEASGYSGLYLAFDSDVTLRNSRVNDNYHHGLVAFSSVVRLEDNDFRRNDRTTDPALVFPTVALKDTTGVVEGNDLTEARRSSLAVKDGEGPIFLGNNTLAFVPMACDILQETGASAVGPVAYIESATGIMTWGNQVTGTEGCDGQKVGGNGGLALEIRGGSRVAMHLDTVEGGAGGDALTFAPTAPSLRSYGGVGGLAVQVLDSPEIATDRVTFRGGRGGDGQQVNAWVSVGGRGGWSTNLSASNLVDSDSRFLGGDPGLGYSTITSAWSSGPRGNILSGRSDTSLLLTNTSLEGSDTKDLALQDSSSATFVNVSFNKTRVDLKTASELVAYWYLAVYVNDTQDIPVSDATVLVEDVNDMSVVTGFTDAAGHLSWIQAKEFRSFANPSSVDTTYYTPHNITAVKSGTGYADPEPVMDASKTVTVTLKADFSPPWVLLYEPIGAGIPVCANLRIIFSRSMDASSVEGNLTVSPAASFTFDWSPGNNSVTLTPSPCLEHETRYVVRLTADGVRNATAPYRYLDGNHNTVEEGTPADDFFWDFTTEPLPDTQPPTVVFHSPTGSNVDPYAPVTVEFSEPGNQTAVELYMAIDPGVTGSFFWVSAYRFTFIHPGSAFKPGGPTTVVLPASITDLAGNTLDGNGNGSAEGSPADDFSWSFTLGAAAGAAPTVASTTPAANATDVGIDEEIEITFTEPMMAGTVQAATSISPAVNFTSEMDEGGQTSTIRPDAYLAFNTTYCVTVNTSAFSLSGIPLDGNGNGTLEGSPDDDYTWCFTTMLQEAVPPRVLNRVPTGISVPVDTEVYVMFSERMDKATVETGVVFFPAANYTVSWIGNTAILDPVSYLPYGTLVTVNVTAAVTDLSGNLLDGDGDGTGGDQYSWGFTTGAQEAVPPRVTGTSPLGGATSVPVSTALSLTFNERMDKGSVADAFLLEGGGDVRTPNEGTVTWSANNLTFQFLPDADLLYGVDYVVSVNGSLARDISMNRLDGDGDGTGGDSFQSTFRTALPSIYPPVVTANFPLNTASNVPLNTTVSVTFNQTMDRISVESAFLLRASGLPPVSGSFAWSGDTMTFTPTPPGLEYLKTYTATVLWTARATSGLTLDGNGNANAEPSSVDNYVFRFTTRQPPDNVPPKVCGFEPPSLSGISVYTSVSVTFCEDMDQTSLAVLEAITVTPSPGPCSRSISARTLYCDLPAPLPGSTLITVTINGTVVQDLAGNLLDGNGDGTGGDDFTWTFTTGSAVPDTTPPTVASYAPQGSCVEIVPGLAVIVRFNESMNITATDAAFAMAAGNTTWTSANGTFVWTGIGEFSFTPDPAFAEFVNYTVTLNGSLARDEAGNLLDGDGDGFAGGNFTWSFDTCPVSDTEPPTVTWVFPGGVDVPVATHFRLAFSEPMDTDSVEQSLRYDVISVSGPSTYYVGDVLVSWTPDGDFVDFTPKQALPYCANVVLSLAGGVAADTRGNLLDGDQDSVPGGDFLTAFSTDCLPNVWLAAPEGPNAGVGASVVVTFSEPMDIASVDLSTTVDGPVLPSTSFSWNVANDVLTISFADSLAYYSAYNVTIASPGAEDKTGLPLDGDYDQVPDGAADAYAWSFTTVRLPAVVSAAYNATDAPVDAPIVLTFNESMGRNSVLAALNVSPVAGYMVAWSADSKVLTINPSLRYSVNYTWTLSGAVAASAYGVLLDGDGDGAPGGDYTWTVSATALSTVASSDPARNAVDVPVTTGVTLVFSKDMDVDSVEAALTVTGVGPSGGLSPSFGLTWTGARTLVVGFSGNLLYNATYTLTISSPNVTSADGLPFDGNGDGILQAGDAFLLRFRTDLPPTVVAFSPANGSTVSLTATILIEFSEAMDEAATLANTEVRRVGGAAVAVNAVWNGTTLQLLPTGPLAHNGTYRVAVGHNATDATGTALDGNRDDIPSRTPEDDVSFEFTARTDVEPPLVVWIDPPRNFCCANVTREITLLFSEPMDRISVELTFQLTWNATQSWSFPADPLVDPFVWSSDSTRVTFRPSLTQRFAAGLPANTRFRVTLQTSATYGSPTDLGGNILEPFTSTFSTVDVLDPTLRINSPKAGEAFAVGTSVTISGEAEDDAGFALLEVYVDEVRLCAYDEDPEPEIFWACEYDTSGRGLGQHDVRVRVVDRAGHVTERTVSFVLQEAAPLTSLNPFLVVLVLVLLGIIAALLLLRRRKAGPKEEELPEEEAEESVPAEGPRESSEGESPEGGSETPPEEPQ